MEYQPTLSSAINFASVNRLEEWIHLFLCGEGNNKAFSDGLKLEPRRYFTPEIFPLDNLQRCCGPEKYMKYQAPEKSFIRHVNNMALTYKEGGWDMPPLIVYRKGSTLELNDGNHRYEALKILGIKQYWVIMWETINEI